MCDIFVRYTYETSFINDKTVMLTHDLKRNNTLMVCLFYGKKVRGKKITQINT
jgi:hypothetical protein